MANLPLNCVNTVLFDLDDTLLDSYSARIQALDDVFSQVNIADINSDSLVSGLQGANFKEALDRIAETYHVKDNMFNFYRRAYWFKKGRISLYPCITEMLEKLKSRGLKLGIVTNKGRYFEFEGKHVGCIDELKEVGIYNYFSAIVGFEDVNEGKPHPEGIHVALNRLDSKPQETLFVGDSAADIGAALNADCIACYAAWGVPEGTRLPDKLNPRYTVKTPSDLLGLDCF